MTASRITFLAAARPFSVILPDGSSRILGDDPWEAFERAEGIARKATLPLWIQGRPDPPVRDTWKAKKRLGKTGAKPQGHPWDDDEAEEEVA